MLNRNSLPVINDKATDAEMNEMFKDLMENGPIDLQQSLPTNTADSKVIA